MIRINKNEEGSPMCALFQADGGAWKLDAIKNIALFLKAKLPEDLTIIC